MDSVNNPKETELIIVGTFKVIVWILGALLLFLFALDLMISSLQHLGRDTVQTIIQATSNPFTGLFIGLLVTAMIQSSSTTTAVVVAMVASGSLTLQSAVPVIMGANVGTTITSTIVSLGFINKKKEFKRAVAAGTYHCFFNLLTVVVLFPLEYYYRFLSFLSESIARYFFTPSVADATGDSGRIWSGISPVSNFLIEFIPSGFFLIMLAFVMLFTSILLFRKLISDLLKAKSPEAFSRFFFRSQFKSFLWGLVTTAAIRSSTITTSVVVPIVAKKIASLRMAAPFVMGANIGTTITAFIAVALNPNTSGAVSIAIVHFLFNCIGVLIFFPVTGLQLIPIKFARSLGQLTLRYRLAGFVFILITFFFLPFSLIYLNRDSLQTTELTYECTDEKGKTYYRLYSTTNTHYQTGQWIIFQGGEKKPDEEPKLIYPVSMRDNFLFVGRDKYSFSRPGFCWDGENETGKYNACIEQILPRMTFSSSLSFDSVYVYNLRYSSNGSGPLFYKIHLSAPDKVILKRERYDSAGKLLQREEIIAVEKK